MKKSSQDKSVLGRNLAIGAGILAASAAAYYMFGSSGKSNRKELRGWMIKMKGEIIDALEKTGSVTQGAYDAVIDTVAARYLNTKGVSREDVEKLTRELKNHWRKLSAPHKARVRKTLQHSPALRSGKKARKAASKKGRSISTK